MNPIKTVCQQVQTETGDVVYLLVKWWTATEVEVEVTNGVLAWKSQRCCPTSPCTSCSREVWEAKTREALGLVQGSTVFDYEVRETERGACELRWKWPMEDVKGFARVLLTPIQRAVPLQSFLNAACELSTFLTVMTVENTETQSAIKNDMLELEQEIKKAYAERINVYQKCKALFTEKKRELMSKAQLLEAKDRELNELRARLGIQPMDVDEHYSDDTD